MRIFFNGPARYGKLCDKYTNTCINQCRYSPQVKFTALAPRIRRAAAWSHHGCESKRKDNQIGRIKVNRMNKWFTISAPDRSGWYSGGMSRGRMGDAWGAHRSQDHCDDSWVE